MSHVSRIALTHSRNGEENKWAFVKRKLLIDIANTSGQRNTLERGDRTKRFTQEPKFARLSYNFFMSVSDSPVLGVPRVGSV